MLCSSPKKHRRRKIIQEGIPAEKTTCHVQNGKSSENPFADVSAVCSFSLIIAELLSVGKKISNMFDVGGGALI